MERWIAKKETKEEWLKLGLRARIIACDANMEPMQFRLGDWSSEAEAQVEAGLGGRGDRVSTFRLARKEEVKQAECIENLDEEVALWEADLWKEMEREKIIPLSKARWSRRPPQMSGLTCKANEFGTERRTEANVARVTGTRKMSKKSDGKRFY